MTYPRMSSTIQISEMSTPLNYTDEVSDPTCVLYKTLVDPLQGRQEEWLVNGPLFSHHIYPTPHPWSVCSYLIGYTVKQYMTNCCPVPDHGLGMGGLLAGFLNDKAEEFALALCLAVQMVWGCKSHRYPFYQLKWQWTLRLRNNLPLHIPGKD